MMAQTALQAERRIRRALLVTCGPLAEALAADVNELSHVWLAIEPPLAIVSAEAEGDAWLDDALASLADGQRSAALRAAGWEVARNDEIQVWILLDAAAAEEGSAPPAGALPLRWSGLAERAWRRLRIHLAWCALVLAAPACEEQAAQWAADLTAGGVETTCIVGPVDAARQCWEPAWWLRRAATGLTTLLWADTGLIGPASGADPEGCAAAWSIGAAAWLPPAAQLKAQVALRCARLVVAHWLTGPFAPEGEEATGTPPWEVPGLLIAPEQHRLALEASVPPEPAGQIWQPRRPDWHIVRDLPARLQAAADKRAGQMHAEQYERRGAWLAAQVTAWEAALAQLRRDRLAPAAGWSQPQLHALELHGLVTQLQSACAQIEDWLEEAGRRFEQTVDAQQRAAQELAAVCALFPPPTRAGLFTALIDLWRWPALVWAYLVRLPRGVQRYLDAWERQEQARRLEANVHALRQAHLAMAQITREGQREAEHLLRRAEEVAAALAQEADAVAGLAPWTAAGVDGLAAELLPELNTGLLETLAMPRDAEPSVGEPVTPASVVAERFLARVAAGLCRLDTWTAADSLTKALDDAGLARWLTGQIELATPLWPVTAQPSDTVVWLLMPDGGAAVAADRAAAGQVEDALRTVCRQGACAGVQMRHGGSGLDAVLLLRITPVELEGGRAIQKLVGCDKDAEVP